MQHYIANNGGAASHGPTWSFFTAVPDSRPGQGDIFAPARNLVGGLAQDSDETCSSLRRYVLGISWCIQCHPHLGTKFWSSHLKSPSSFFQQRSQRSKVGADESKCREGLRVTFESEIEVRRVPDEFAIRLLRKSSVNISQAFLGFLLLFLAPDHSPALIMSICSRRWVDRQARTNKPKATTWSALDGRWYHGQWGYEHQLLNYWWNRVKKVNWCKLIPRPCRAYSQIFFLADLPVWWVLPKPESCRNSARILANGVTKV